MKYHVICVLAGAALLAATSAPRAEEEVRVYTNADLERLEPLPQQTERVASAAPQGEDWDLLVRMLELDAQRNREARAEQLERERFALAQQAMERAQDYAEYNGYIGYPYGGYGYGGFWGGGFGPAFGTTTINPTPEMLLMNRLRNSMGQRGITSTQAAFEEYRHEAMVRHTQPPLGRRSSK